VRVTDTEAESLERLTAMGLERREARWLVEEFGPDLATDDSSLRRAAKRRLDGEPLQYVLGHWPFRSLDLDVDGRVLIPRPETEELVTLALEELARLDRPAPLILDLGCGSGAIGLALLDELASRGVHASVVAVDSSLEALEVTKANARKHSIQAISLVHSNWFDDLDPSLRGRVDLIVANPPYVGGAEFETLDAVLRYEPLSALVAERADDVEGFGDVAHIVAGAPTWLSETGSLVLEHGEDHGDVAVTLARSVGFTDSVDHRDLAGHPRVLVARRA
jgi:release factor glutamine methyltransferase